MNDQPERTDVPHTQEPAHAEPTAPKPTTPDPPQSASPEPTPQESATPDATRAEPSPGASPPLDSVAPQPVPSASPPPESAPAAPSPPESDRPAPAHPAPDPPSPSSADIDREVAEAMAGMTSADLDELTGGAAAGDLEPGAEVTGTVVDVTGDDVFLTIGVKSQAVVPRSHFGKKEPLEKGRRVDLVIERFDSDAGLHIAARKGASQRATWATLNKGMIVEGRITGMNKGGLEMDVQGIRAFMPASQADIAQLKDISVLLNEKVRAVVLEVDRRHKNVLVSRRRAQEQELAEARDKVLGELTVGQIRKGVVGNITEFGAFVNLGGVDGLVHISDISWGSVDKVGDVLKPGQEVQVKVTKIDKKRDRISLSIKEALPDPWEGITDRYSVGSAAKVRVVRVTDFGAFAELEPGVDGLIPISEMSWTRIRNVGEAVSVGDVVDAVVIRIEPEKRRVALSMKQAAEDPWGGVLESFPEKSLVNGKVTRLTDFGAFVELVPGVEGLIHISELSHDRVRTCADVVQPNQQIEARVLGVDLEQRRISLSIKAVSEDPRAVAGEQESKPKKQPKKRKKPLRGGLDAQWDWAGGLNLTLDDKG